MKVWPKTLELLHELIPTASVVALLLNPVNPVGTEVALRSSQAVARTLGLDLHVLNASTESDFDGVFANLIQLRVGGLIIAPDPFFTSRQEQLAALALRDAVPAVYLTREFAVAGGLASYGSTVPDAYRLPAFMSPVFSKAKSQASCRYNKPRKSSCS